MSNRRKQIKHHISEEELVKYIDEFQSKEEAHLVRRLCFVKNLYAGDNLVEAASRVGMSETTGSRWAEHWNRGGVDGLRPDWGSGRPRKLPKSKLPELKEMLLEGAESYDFMGDRWTLARVAKVIEWEFEVSVTAATAGEYLHEMNWSNKKPQRRGIERDAEAINEFRNTEWEQIRRKAEHESLTVVFVDESKFCILPPFRSTWAPVGETPIVETVSSFESLSAVSAITYILKTQKLGLKFHTQQHNYNTQDLFPFFSDIIHKLSHEPLFLMDNWSPHKSTIRLIKEDTVDMPIDVTIKYFPEYASDLNPVDRVWGYSKNKLANYAAKSLDELQKEVEDSLNKIGDNQKLLRSFIHDAGLEIDS